MRIPALPEVSFYSDPGASRNVPVGPKGCKRSAKEDKPGFAEKGRLQGLCLFLPVQAAKKAEKTVKAIEAIEAIASSSS